MFGALYFRARYYAARFFGREDDGDQPPVGLPYCADVDVRPRTVTQSIRLRTAAVEILECCE